MGYGSYTDDAYKSISTARSSAPVAAVFTVHTPAAAAASPMASLNMTVREACDSDEHPNTVPVIVALDVTGSMGGIPVKLSQGDFTSLMGTLVNNGVTDVALLFMAIGDHISDRSPLQVGQFESDTAKIDQWLTGMYLERGGGGTNEESYPLAWLVAARKTRTDAFDKRGRKGFLFTIGDESFHKTYNAANLTRILGDGYQDLTAEQLFVEASRRWHIFHIHCTDGSNGDGTTHAYSYPQGVGEEFRKLLGQRYMAVNSSLVAHTIGVTVGTLCGVDAKILTSSMSADTAALVLRATSTAVSKADSTALDVTTGVIDFSASA